MYACMHAASCGIALQIDDDKNGHQWVFRFIMESVYPSV